MFMKSIPKSCGMGPYGGSVKEQGDVQEPTIPSSNRSAAFAYFMAGLWIGAAVSIILAPRSGTETRLRIANKVLNGIDTANEKVRQTRLRVMHMMDHGQEKITEVVVAGREAVGKLKAAVS
jgi:gas vesicle protein